MYESQFPLAASALRSDVYVDDILVGAETLADTANLRGELIELLNVAGFELKKWSSNRTELLSGIPEEDREPTLLLTDPDSRTVHILGLT